MAGLIDSQAIALCEINTGLTWLTPGLGVPDGLSNDTSTTPATAMLYEDGTAMLYESGDFMLYE